MKEVIYLVRGKILFVFFKVWGCVCFLRFGKYGLEIVRIVVFYKLKGRNINVFYFFRNMV